MMVNHIIKLTFSLIISHCPNKIKLGSTYRSLTEIVYIICIIFINISISK